MKIFLLWLILFFYSFNINSSGYNSITAVVQDFCPKNYKEQYIKDFYNKSISIANLYNIPISIVISQSIIEQGWYIENHKKNNWRIYNITGKKGVKYNLDGKRYTFRTYKSFEESLVDYCSFISDCRYNRSEKNDANSRINDICNGGYAESPTYKKEFIKINNLVERYIQKTKKAKTFKRKIWNQ